MACKIKVTIHTVPSSMNKRLFQCRPSKVQPFHIKSMYGRENEAKRKTKEEEHGRMGMEEETKMEIGLFSAVVSAALIFLIAYYFIYINAQSKSYSLD